MKKQKIVKPTLTPEELKIAAMSKREFLEMLFPEIFDIAKKEVK